MGSLGPLWPKYNAAKRGQGGSSSAPKARWVPNHKWAHLSQFWPKNWPRATSSCNSAHGLWQPPEATSSAPRKDSPQVQWKTFPTSMHPALKDQGVAHIWYNIPLCTIVSQQSNVEVSRTELRDSKSSLQSITNSKGGFFSYSVWQLPGGYQKTIQAPQPPGPAGVGL
ncbi:hypothetical protein O181_081528 [Austropuccinia psidii MF-1]|uniref:Uncharacterized protein n=1 Tax=Austropuccinia psidii MF-1 TaxID=1389203 RepID=A0A9Q3FQ09_9BASI|nr:hypothetical protein [Austropuccinia psidii MF-1]